ncbi:MAG TPA: YceI family protein [Acidimicrobiales bacterium]|jgi:polyisoprenoid-binding protein YceI|nr:YceI family protein [Acidimicrobiales bacterium]
MSDTSTSTGVLSGTYNLDPSHSRIGFVARHAMVTKVRGSFNEVSGSGSYDADDPTRSTLNVALKVESIDTRNADRDAHLKTADFFEQEKYPEITFASTAVKRVDDETFEVTGDLAIKGTTKPVTFELEVSGPVQDPWGNTRIGLEGKTEVSRKDWGLTFNVPLDGGGLLVSDKITLEFEVAAVKA